MDQSIREALETLEFVVFDFDGVFTDNRVIVCEDGTESVLCCRSDGLGLKRLRECGIEAMILSTETNPVVSARARKLELPCSQGHEDKASQLRDELAKRGLDPARVAYVGNDINDVGCLGYVGLPVLVADAYEEVVPLGRLRLERKGGEGAVREFCDLVWRAKSEPRS